MQNTEASHFSAQAAGVEHGRCGALYFSSSHRLFTDMRAETTVNILDVQGREVKPRPRLKLGRRMWQHFECTCFVDHSSLPKTLISSILSIFFFSFPK